MIFVTVGTQDKQFVRLLQSVERANIDDEIIMQSGNTDFKTNKENIKIHKFLSPDEVHSYMKSADQIISHAGVGTIINGLKMNKKMIVAARLKKYKEHVNDHQIQLLDNFAEAGYILPLRDFSKLEELINMPFKPRKFESNNKNFVRKLNEEIFNLTDKEKK